MQTVILKLDARKMKNPDLDILTILPERVEEITNEAVYDNGYDYLSGTEIGIWLAAEDAADAAEMLLQLIQAEQFAENDLSAIAEIYISEQDSAPIADCSLFYPADESEYASEV